MKLTQFILTLLLLSTMGCSPEEPAVRPTLSIEGMEVEEGSNSKTIYLIVSVSETTTVPVSFLATTIAGTAEPGVDYEEIVSRKVTFNPGDEIVAIAVNIYGDDEFEEDETFTVNLTNAQNGDLLVSEATVTILNDDTSQTELIPSTGYSTPTTYPGMSLIWSDEFDGTDLNSSNWTYEFGNWGWGNNELQYYTDQNTRMIDGHLVIDAKQENFGGSQYTSSRIITQDKFEFEYGRVDIRAVLPEGQGIWPALWMLGANFSDVGWPSCGEIDVMEMIGGNGREKTVHGTAHWQASNGKADFGGSTSLSTGTFNDEFHVFSIVWDENIIRWYMDDVEYHALSITASDLSEFRAPFFFIFNIAVGGNWPGNPNASTQFPQHMVVDYIRVFQEN